MKLGRLSTTLYNIKTQLGLGNVLGSSSSYSTATGTATREVAKILRKGSSMYKLYRRLSPMGDTNESMVPLLDQWVEEGRPLDMEQLRIIIKKFRLYKRFSHALHVLKSWYFYYNLHCNFQKSSAKNVCHCDDFIVLLCKIPFDGILRWNCRFGNFSGIA